MKKVVATNPLNLGYGFSISSAARLTAHLAKVTKIQFSTDQLKRLLPQEGYSVHRPKHTMKGRSRVVMVQREMEISVCGVS